jgi:hypothetical protein
MPCRGHALIDMASGAPIACGQVVREGRLAGVYDVVTAQ